MKELEDLIRKHSGGRVFSFWKWWVVVFTGNEKWDYTEYPPKWRQAWGFWIVNKKTEMMTEVVIYRDPDNPWEDV